MCARLCCPGFYKGVAACSRWCTNSCSPRRYLGLQLVCSVYLVTVKSSKVPGNAPWVARPTRVPWLFSVVLNECTRVPP